MNPFDVLNQIRKFRALLRVLIRKSGERVEAKALPEWTRAEAFQWGMIGEVAISAWSTNDVDLNPGEGDVFELTTDDVRAQRSAGFKRTELTFAPARVARSIRQREQGRGMQQFA